MNGEFLEKHPKFRNFMQKSGVVISPILETLGAVTGVHLLSTLGKAIDNLDMPDNLKAQAKEILKSEMSELNELEGLILSDIQDARKNNTTIQVSDKPSWLAKNIAYCIDIVLTLVWATLTIYIACKWINLITDNSNMTGVLGLYATVTGTFAVSLQFHRGSSVGSKQKDEQISAMMQK